MSTDPNEPRALAACDEIIEVPAVPDAELQAIDCVRQVLNIFFPGNSFPESRQRVLVYCTNRFSASGYGPGPMAFLPSRPPPGRPPGNPPSVEEQAGLPPGFFEAAAKATIKARDQIDKDEIIPPEKPEEGDKP